MIDFKLILLLVGLGLLVLVAVFALLGFFAGFKKELKCAAIAFVLVLLAFLVFGDSSWILNADGSILKSFLKGIPESAKTVWECILAYAKSAVEGGEEIFVEGSESYAFLYNLVSGIFRGVGLVLGTFVMMIIIMITNIIYRSVSRGVAKKKAKAAKAAALEQANEVPDEAKVLAETVLVAQSEDGSVSGAVVSTSKKEVKDIDPKKHIWGAVLGAVRAIVIIMILFAPIAGVCSVVDDISPETEDMLHELVAPSNNKKTANNPDIIDYVMDFNDAYQSSAVGQFVEGSKYFFVDSFSTQLFDSAFVVKSNGDKIVIREELDTIVLAVNELEGNIDTSKITASQADKALEVLKDSKLIPAALPVAIEVAYYMPIKDNAIFKGSSLEDLLFKSGKQAAFLSLREADWDKEIDNLLDVAKDVIALGVLTKDFNPLTMDAKTVAAALGKVANSEAITGLLDIVGQTALKVEAVTKLTGELENQPDWENFSWKDELNNIAVIYADFQKVGITDMKDLSGEALFDTINNVLNDNAKYEALATTLADVIDLQLVKEIGIQVGINKLTESNLVKDANENLVKDIKDLTKLDWTKEIKTYLDAVKEALPLVKTEEGKLPSVDIYDLNADVLNKVVDKLFETESLAKILPIATNLALENESIKSKFGTYQINIDTNEINWKDDFKAIVSVYAEAQASGALNEEALKNINDLLVNTFSDDAKAAHVENALSILADTSLFNKVVTPVANAIVNTILSNSLPEIADLIDLDSHTADEWKEDFHAIVEAAKEVNNACGFEFALDKIDFSDAGVESLQNVLEYVLTLNLLQDDQVKSDLAIGVIDHFKLFDQVDIDKIDLEGLNWVEGENNELDNLKQFVADFAVVQAVKGFDLSKMDFATMIEQEDFIESVTDVLETVADSEFLLQLIPGVINKYVVPAIESIDDEDGTIDEVLHHLSSKELVEEVTKLIDVAKAIGDLHVLKVASNGVSALDFKNTEAMKTIVNGVFDSKILEGYEGRIIRLGLKLTKLFENIEKGAFDNIDYDLEQANLIAAIDALEIVLKDDSIKFTEDGKLDISKQFIASSTTFGAALNALDALLGVYDPATGSQGGSEIVKVVLPEAYDKYVSKVVPANFQELVDIMALDELDGAELLSDIQHIVYAGRQLYNLNVNGYIADGDYDFSYDVRGKNAISEAFGNILDAIFDTNFISGKENELVAWGVNKLIDSTKLNIEKFEANDFADVDWDNEVDVLHSIIIDVFDLLNANDLTKVSKILDFVKNAGFKDEKYYTQENADLIIAVLSDVDKLGTLKEILPVALTYGLDILEKQGISFEKFGKNVNKEYLVEDLQSIFDAVKILVDDCGIVDLYVNKWNGAIPEAQYIVDALDILFHLHILDGKQMDIIATLFKKFVPANDYFNKNQIIFNACDAENEIAMIEAIIPVALDFFKHINVNTVKGAIEFVTKQQYNEINLVTEYNLLAAADLLDAVANSDLVALVLKAVAATMLDKATMKTWGDFSPVANVKADVIKSDFNNLAEIVRKAVKVGAIEYWSTKDIQVVDFETLNEIIADVFGLNTLAAVSDEVLPSVMNKLISRFNLKIEKEFTPADFADVELAEEGKIIGQAVEMFGKLLASRNVDSLNEILAFVKDGDYLDPIFLNADAAINLINIVSVAFQSELIKAVSVAGFEYGLDIAKNKGFDLTFLKGKLTGAQLMSDLNTILEVAQDLVDFGLVGLVMEKKIEGFNIEYLVDAVSKIEEINILTADRRNFIGFVVEQINDKLHLNLMVRRGDYAESYIDYANENLILQNIVRELGDILHNENLNSLEDIKEFINKAYYKDVNAYNEDVIENVENIIRLAVSSQLVALHLTDVYNYGINLAEKKLNLDLSDLTSGALKYHSADIVNDINVLIDFVNYIIEFGAVDFAIQGNIQDLDVTPIQNAIPLLENIKLLTKGNKAISTIAYNFLAKKLGADEVTSALFADVDFAADNALLVEIVGTIGKALKELKLNSVADIVKFVKDAKFKNEKIYSDYLLDLVEDLVEEIAESELLEAIIPGVVNFALDKVSKSMNKDFSSLKVENNYGAVLLSDISSLAHLVHYAPVGLSIMNGNEIDFDMYDKVRDILVSIGSMNYLNDKFNAIYTIIDEQFVKNISLTQYINPADIDLAADMDAVAGIYKALIPVLKDAEQPIHTINDIKGVKFTKDLIYSLVYNHQTEIADAVYALTAIDFLPGVVKTAAEVVDDKLGGDIKKLYNIVGIKEIDNELLREDVVTISEILRDVKDIDVLGFVFYENALYFDNKDAYVSIVEKVVDMNLLRGAIIDLVKFGCNKMGIEFDKDLLNAVDLDHEADLVVKVAGEALDLLYLEDLHTIGDVNKFISDKAFVKRYAFSDDIFAKIQEIAYDITDSQILEATIKGAFNYGIDFAEKLTKKDLESIKATVTTNAEMIADAKSFIDLLDYGMIIVDILAGRDIDFNMSTEVRDILNTIGNNNYINDELVDIFNVVDEQFLTNIDLGQYIDPAKITLAADMKVLGSIYNLLIPVLNDNYQPVKNIKTTKIELEANNIKDLIYNHQIVFVNVVEQLANISFAPGAIKTVAELIDNKLGGDIKKLYNIVGVKDIDDELLRNDITTLSKILKNVKDLDVVGYVLFKNDVKFNKATIKDLVKNVTNLNLLRGAIVELAKFGCKKMNIEYDSAAMDAIDVAHEADLVYALTVNVLDVLDTINVKSLQNVFDLMNNKSWTKESFYSDELFAGVAKVLDNITDSQFFAATAKGLVNFGVEFAAKALNKDLDSVKPENVSNADIVADIKELAALTQYGMIGVNAAFGNDIDFDIAAEVRDIFTTIGNNRYINSELVDIYKLVDEQFVTKYDLQQYINPAEINLAADMNVLANVYEILVPVLTDPLQPIHSINDVKNLKSVTTTKNALKALAYNNQDTAIAAIRELFKFSVLPGAVKTGAEIVDDKLGGDVKKLYNIVGIKEMSDADLREDLFAITNILEDVVTLDVLGYVFYKNDIPFVQSAIVDAVKNLTGLHMIEKSLVELVKFGCNKMGIEYDNDILNALDYDKEAALISTFTSDLITLGRELKVESFQDALDFVNKQVWKKEATYTDTAVYIIRDVLTDLSNSQLLLGTIKGLANFGIDKAAAATNKDLSALKVQITNEELMADFASLIHLVNYTSNVTEILADKRINYNQPEVVEDVLTTVLGMNYVKAQFAGIYDVIDTQFVTKYDLQQYIDASAFDLDNDAQVLADIYEMIIPVFEDPAWPLKIMSSPLKFAKTDIKNLVYNHQAEYANVIEKVSELSQIAGIVKTVAEIFDDNLGGDIKKLYNIVGVKEMSDADLKEDVYALGEILRDVTAIDVLNYVLFQNEITINNAENNQKLVGDVYDLHMVYDNLGEFVKYFLNKAKIDYDHALMGSVDWDQEKTVLMYVVEDASNALLFANVNTIADVKSFINNKAWTKESTYSSKLIDSVQNIVIDVTLSQIFYAMNKELVNFGLEKVGKAMNKDLSSIYVNTTSRDELNDDIYHLQSLLDYTKNVVEILAGHEINYDQADVVDDILVTIGSLNYINDEFADIYTLIDDQFVTKFDLSAYVDPANFDVVNVFETLSLIYEDLIPVFECANWPIKTIKNVSINADNIKEAIYKHQDELANVIEDFAGMSQAAGLVKTIASNFEDKITGTAKEFYDIIDIYNMADADLAEDIYSMGAILRDANVLDVLGLVLYQHSIDLGHKDAVTGIVDKAYDLHMVNDHLVQFLDKALSKLGVASYDAAAVNAIDWAQEKTYILAIVDSVMDVIQDLAITNSNDLIAYAKDTLAAVKADVKDAISLAKDKHIKTAIKTALSTIRTEAKKTEVVKLENILVNALSLQTIEAVGLSVYQYKVYAKLSGVKATIASIHDYSNEQFADDLALIKDAIHQVVASGIHTVLSNKAMPADRDACVAALENAVKDFCNLAIIDVKLQDIATVLDYVKGKVNLSAIENYVGTLDFNSINWTAMNFASDADLYAAMVGPSFDFVSEILANGVGFQTIGDSLAMYSLINIADEFSQTTFAHEFAPFVVNMVNNAVDKLLSKQGFVKVDADAAMFNTVDILYGIYDLGIFSNNGFDLTNKAKVQEIVDTMYATVKVPAKVQDILDKLVGRIDSYGVIPFSWENIPLKEEIKNLVAAAKAVKNFLNDYKFAFQSGNYAVVATAGFQQRAQNVVYNILDSIIVDQLVKPFVEGTFRALTASVDGELVYDNTLSNKDLASQEFATIWKLVAAVEEITHFSSNIDYFQFDAYYDIFDAIKADQIFKDNLATIIEVVANKFLNADNGNVRTADLYAIDWAVEMDNFKAVIAEIEAAYNVNPFTLDASSIKNAVVLEGLGNAIMKLADTQIIEVYGATLLNFLNEKAIKTRAAGLYDVIADKCENLYYVNNFVVDDIKLIGEIIVDLANADVAENLSDFAAWNYTSLKAAINKGFTLKLIEGNEDSVMRSLITKIGAIADFYDDTIVIADWNAELITIISAIEGLVNDGITDLNSIDASSVTTISGSTIKYLVDSDLLAPTIVEKFNEMLANNGMNYSVTIAKLRSVTNWSAEIAAVNQLLDAKELVDNNASGARQAFIDAYDAAAATDLVNEILTACCATILPELDMYKDYLNEVDHSAWNDAKYRAEADVCVAVYKKFQAKGISVSLEDPLNSGLDGEIILAALDSEVLYAAVKKEINAAIASVYSTDPYVLTDADMAALDTAAKWDAELAAIKDLKDLNNMLNNPSATTAAKRTAFISAYDNVMANTILCKAVLNHSAKSILEDAPVYGDNLSLVNTTSWNEAKWAAELAAVVNTFKKMSASDIDDFDNILTDGKSYGATINAAFESDVLAATFLDAINDSLAAEFTDYTDITAAQISSINTESAWDEEVAGLRDLVGLKNLTGSDADKRNQFIAVYDSVKAPNTVLCAIVLNKAAKTILSTAPLYGTNLSLVDSSAWDEAKWGAELGAVVNTFGEMNTIGVNNFDNILTDTTEYGAVINAALQSEVLKATFLQQFNASLGAIGVADGTITATTISTIDTAAKWNTEIAGLREVKALYDAYNAETEMVAKATKALALNNKLDELKVTSVIINAIYDQVFVF